MNTIIPINLGLVYAYLLKGKNGNVLIDCGFPGQEKMILRALEKHRVQKGDLNLIVITHGDIDHYGSSDKLREQLGTPVLVHQADKEIIATGINRKIFPTKPFGHVMKALALLLTAVTSYRYKPFEPDVIMTSEKLSLENYGVDAHLLHTPGETAGSISVVTLEKMIIAGDLIGGLFPHSSTPAYAPFSDNLQQVKKSLRLVLDLDPVKIYTGHSKPIVVQKNVVRLNALSAD